MDTNETPITSSDYTDTSKKSTTTTSKYSSSTSEPNRVSIPSDDVDKDIGNNGVVPVDKETELAGNILKKIITPKMTDFDKVLAIHDYIIDNVEYDHENYIKNTIPIESYDA